MPVGPGDPKDLMTAVDAARILSLSSDMVRLLAREGRLKAALQTVRGIRLFRRADVERLASERAQQARERRERPPGRRRSP
jgi:DNA-binding transcriptional MerR regulator